MWLCRARSGRSRDAEKPHKHHHAKQAGPKAKKREESVKKKKGTLEQSKKDHKNTRVCYRGGTCWGGGLSEAKRLARFGLWAVPILCCEPVECHWRPSTRRAGPRC